jgi:tripartite-type tricarboxylate transporter receptor subunit TctC
MCLEWTTEIVSLRECRSDRNVRNELASLAMALLIVLAPMAASAQEPYPNRPIKILVPFAPGGAVDIVARIVSEHMRQTLGQSLVIENKPGAVGVVAIEQMVRAKHDGYTLMFGNNNSNVITPICTRRSSPSITIRTLFRWRV